MSGASVVCAGVPLTLHRLSLWSTDIPALRNVSPDIQTNVGSVWSLQPAGNSCHGLPDNS